MFVGCPCGTRDRRLVPADIGATRLNRALLPVWFRQQAAGSGCAAGGFLRRAARQASETDKAALPSNEPAAARLHRKFDSSCAVLSSRNLRIVSMNASSPRVLRFNARKLMARSGDILQLLSSASSRP